MQEGSWDFLPLIQLNGVNCSQLGEQVLKCIPSRRNSPAFCLRDQRASCSSSSHMDLSHPRTTFLQINSLVKMG